MTGIGYEELADELIGSNDRIAGGTMMGFPCLRYGGRFFASLQSGTGRLIVKLPADRVAVLVESGAGAPFAPAGRVFREWVAVEDLARWRDLAREAVAFAEEQGG